MSRYLKAEFFRIRKSKSALISLFLIPAFILINFAIGYRGGNVEWTTTKPINSDFIMIIGEALQAFITVILIIPIYATINKEINEHGMEKALESGIRPVSIYLSKFISNNNKISEDINFNRKFFLNKEHWEGLEFV